MRSLYAYVLAALSAFAVCEWTPADDVMVSVVLYARVGRTKRRRRDDPADALTDLCPSLKPAPSEGWVLRPAFQPLSK